MSETDVLVLAVCVLGDLFELFFHVVVVLGVQLSTDVNVVVAQTDELTLHSVDALEWIEIESLCIVDVPEADVLPKLTSQQDGGEHQRLPVAEPDLDLGGCHDLFDVDQAD